MIWLLLYRKKSVTLKYELGTAVILHVAMN